MTIVVWAIQTVRISELDLFNQFEMLFAHFEEDLYVPAFSIEPDDFCFFK